MSLRRFLRLTTGVCAIPYGGFKPKINIQKSTQFLSHVCWRLLDSPDFPSGQELSDTLAAALAVSDSRLEDPD